jgi:hypothetical protein
MIICLIISLLIGQFEQKFYLDEGTLRSRGRVLVCDSDRDLQIELIFGYYENLQDKIVIYELYPDSLFHLEAIIDTMSDEAWDVGDFDNDGLFDIVIGGDFGLPVVGPQIYESPDSFSYPTREVWRDTVGQAAVTPISVHDIDRDGLLEIVKVGADGIDFVIYETIGDNLYARIYEDTIQGINTPLSTIAFGDFDNDSKIEFVLGNLSDGVGAAYWLYESYSDNTYEFIHLGSVPTKNIKDCFTVPDADGDGKLEFVVKGFVVPTARIHAFIFEAVSNNTYEIVKSFDLFGGSNDYYGGYSEAGDVDGDSIPEIVLEGCQNIYIIKSESNDSFYVWDTLPGHTNGSCVRVYDIDDNGLSEIIISGNNETKIYEYVSPGISEETGSQVERISIEVFPNPFKNSTTIRYTIQDTGYMIPNRNVGQGFSPTLKIYDATGRLVKDFSRSTTYDLRSTHVVWDGIDDKGRTVSQGVYFLRIDNLDSGDILCQKVLRIK